MISFEERRSQIVEWALEPKHQGAVFQYWQGNWITPSIAGMQVAQIINH
jgi:hypothetical protein